MLPQVLAGFLQIYAHLYFDIYLIFSVQICKEHTHGVTSQKKLYLFSRQKNVKNTGFFFLEFLRCKSMMLGNVSAWSTIDFCFRFSAWQRIKRRHFQTCGGCKACSLILCRTPWILKLIHVYPLCSESFYSFGYIVPPAFLVSVP